MKQLSDRREWELQDMQSGLDGLWCTLEALVQTEQQAVSARAAPLWRRMRREALARAVRLQWVHCTFSYYLLYSELNCRQPSA